MVEGGSRAEDNRELIITAASRDRVYYPGTALIPIIDLTRPGREDTILEKEGLIPRNALFNDMPLPGLFLLALALLEEQGVKLFLGLLCQVMVKVFVPIRDVGLHLYFSGVDGAIESGPGVIKDDDPISVFFDQREEVDPWVVGLEDDSPALALMSLMADPDLLICPRRDDDPGGSKATGGAGGVGDELLAIKVFNNCNMTVIRVCDIPDIRRLICYAVSVEP